MPSYGFHFEAADEYFEATRYYLTNAPPLIAAPFVGEIETSIETLLKAPTMWPVIETPAIRRLLLTRFPYSLYYQWEPEHDHVTIYAVMHLSRLPGYWRDRLPLMKLATRDGEGKPPLRFETKSVAFGRNKSPDSASNPIPVVKGQKSNYHFRRRTD